MIISDSTALIILFDLERMELLENLFERIYITPIVMEEISAKYPVRLPPFMQVRELQNSELFVSLSALLDRGESESIALAKEMSLPIIIDERKGRKIAKAMDLQVIGLLGVIYLNVKKGYLTKEEAVDFVDAVVRHGYRISQKMVDDLLEELR